MSKIFTPNIIVTRDYALLQKLMDTNSFKITLDRVPSDSTTLVISSKQNRYIFELEHSINYGQAQTGITLKFLDTDGKFEDSFLSEPFIQQVLSDAVKRFAANKFDFSEINNYLSAEVNSGLKIYIMYGIGDDVRDWSDPMICSLVRCDVDAAATIRSYSYTFIPDANWFFQAAPVQDKRNPNYTADLNFGAQNFRTSVELPVSRETRSRTADPYASLGKFSSNIRRLIKLYLSKAAATPEGNILVVLPKINEDCAAYSKSEEWVNEKLESILEEEEVTLNRVESSLDPITGQPSISSRNLANQARRTDTFINAKQPTYKGRVPGLQSLNSYRRFYKNIFNIDVCQYLTDHLKTTIRQKVLGQLNVVDLETENLAKAVVEDTSSKLSLIMSAESKSTKQANDSAESQIPNMWSPLHNIELGFKTVGSKPVTIMAFQESNMKMLRLFKKYNLIDSATKPCIVVGDTQMIRDYLYCNQSTADKILTYQSEYEFEQDDPLRYALDNDKEKYRAELIAVKFKNKGNSSFNERLKTDEFSINRLETNLVEETSKLAAVTDIPTFILNLKNSNVISFSVDSGLNYMNAVQAAIADDRSANLLDPIIANKDALLANLGITEDQAKEVTRQIDEVFSKVEKRLEYQQKGAAASLNKVVSKKGYQFLEDVTFFGKPTRFNVGELYVHPEDYNYGVGFDPGDLPTALNINKLGQELATENSEEAIALSQYLAVAQEFAGGSQKKLNFDITTFSYDNVSYLGLAYQLPLKKINPNLNGAKLKNAADLLVLLNQYNLSKGKNSNGAIMTVGVNGPKQNTIQSKILDYAMKNSFKVSLKTLPFFHLSDYFVIGRPAYFYSRKVSLLGGKPKTDLDFFSGQYFIGGFKHVISANNCYSEFTLQKSINAGELKGVQS